MIDYHPEIGPFAIPQQLLQTKKILKILILIVYNEKNPTNIFLI